MSKLPKKSKELNYIDIITSQLKNSIEKPKYCKFCGSQIIHFSNDRKTQYVINWEICNEAHWDCFIKRRGE